MRKAKTTSNAQDRRQTAARNWLAVHAHQRKGGPMKNRKKEANKRTCRKKIRI